MNRKGKITPNQRHQLLQIYLHMDMEESRRACLEYGVNATYAQTLAYTLSLTKTDKRGQEKSFGVDHDDHRWKWAVERGAILA